MKLSKGNTLLQNTWDIMRWTEENLLECNINTTQKEMRQSMSIGITTFLKIKTKENPSSTDHIVSVCK